MSFEPTNVELDIIRRISRECEGKITPASEKLGIPKAELVERLTSNEEYKLAWQEGAEARHTMPKRWEPGKDELGRIYELGKFGWPETKAVCQAFGWWGTPHDYAYIIIEWPEIKEVWEKGKQERERILAKPEGYDPLPEDIPKVQEWAEKGLRTKEIAKLLNVSERQFVEALDNHPELNLAMEHGHADYGIWLASMLKEGIENGVAKGSVQGVIWAQKNLSSGWSDGKAASKAESKAEAKQEQIKVKVPKTTDVADFAEKAKRIRAAKEQSERSEKNA